MLAPTWKQVFFGIFTFLFLQRFGTSSKNMMMNSSNITCTERERQSLLLFKRILRDKSNRLSTWNGVECCEWQGVECDMRSGHVVKLDLRNPVSSFEEFFNNGIEGELSPSLLNLKYLRYLDLSLNNFSGQIPEFFGSFKHLEYLNVSCSGFGSVIPRHLGNLSRLQYLDVSNIFALSNAYYRSYTLVTDDLRWLSSLSSLKHLDLSGIVIGEQIDWFHPINMLSSLLTLNMAGCDINIPFARFVNFTSLDSLNLSLNKINSTIPFWLSNLTSLTYLNFRNNYFHGEIPDFLGIFSSLEKLDLSYNKLVGNISEVHFTKLKNLTSLRLSFNTLTWNVSSRWIPPFQLEKIYLGSCIIGPHFPSWLQTQENLKILDLHNSGIRDTIPEWFYNISSHIYILDLSHNQIGGKLPPFHGSTRDTYLMMNSNNFEGSFTSFPSNIKLLDLSDNFLSGNIPWSYGTMNPSLEVINLSKNRFTGSIPLHLCKVLSIRVLDLSQNKLSGRFPECLGNLNRLQVIDLTNNTITGAISSWLGSLKNLQSLHLYNNRFEGDLPVSLDSLPLLSTMDLGKNLLTGSIPLWIGDKLSNLRFLNLQSNKFTGKIPLQLCQLYALQYLNLAHNNISGRIPHCFRNLKGMMSTRLVDYSSVGNYEENIFAFMKGSQLLYTNTIVFLKSLDLSCNNISGDIPDVLVNLDGLKSLNLSRNRLTGEIPTTIGDLKQLESLDLSFNKLFGRIPTSLSSLNFLSHLNLSFNNLSGTIPVGNQIQTLDNPSIYEGNNLLCAPQVSRSCKGNNSSYNPVGVDEGQDDIEGLWFYVGMGSGFVVGFVGLLGCLHFIRSWRVGYFEKLENVYDWLTLSIILSLAILRRKFFQ